MTHSPRTRRDGLSNYLRKLTRVPSGAAFRRSGSPLGRENKNAVEDGTVTTGNDRYCLPRESVAESRPEMLSSHEEVAAQGDGGVLMATLSQYAHV